MSGFKVVSERTAEQALNTASAGQGAADVEAARAVAAKAYEAQKQAQEAHQQAARYLVTALQVVSQRFVTAVALAWYTMFTALLAASAWWLWSTVLIEPDAAKLTGAALYSVFCLAVEFLRKRA